MHVVFKTIQHETYSSVSRFFQIGAPIQAKKQKFAEQQKLKQLVTKNVNKNVEQEIRQRATDGQINLSKAQQAVVKHHQERSEDKAGPNNQ